jgi:spore coat polysaccharide biosynthesis protein SpsF (cytidylyltransferase family)
VTLTHTIHSRGFDVLPGNILKAFGRRISKLGPGALFRITSDQPFGKSKLG